MLSPGWWLMQLTHYFLGEDLPSSEVTQHCPLSVPVEASTEVMMTASPKGAGSLNAGLCFLGPCTPAPAAVSGAWEGLPSGCWIMSGPPLSVSARQDMWKSDFDGQSLEGPMGGQCTYRYLG